MDWVKAVWQLVPTTLAQPADVTEDGKRGVTEATFNEFLQLSQERVSDRLSVAGVETPDFDDAELDKTLRAAVSQITAAYILRKFPAFEALYKDYFANGFALLDEYIAEALINEDVFDGPEFVGEEEDSAFPQL